MAGAHNDAELVAVLMPALKQAAEYAADEILKLNEQKIKTWVYGKYQPTMYQRTGEFGQAWETHSGSIHTNGSTGKVTASMDYAPDKMPTVNAPVHQGVGKYKDVPNPDVRQYLAEIIYQGLASDMFGNGAWTEARDAFAQLDKTLGKTYGLARYIEKGMRQAGLKFTMNNRHFTKTVT